VSVGNTCAASAGARLTRPRIAVSVAAFVVAAVDLFADAAATDTAIRGRVSLAPALAAQVLPTDTVFVFARNAQGPRMPLAVQRARVSDLPLNFKLDDSLAMSPGTKLSDASEVRIEARISRSGSATPGSGDLIGVGPVVKPGASDLVIQIDQTRP
jgi:cytochrome c-type biogenesis protein CcmH